MTDIIKILLLDMPASWSVDCNISKSIGWTAMKSGTNSHGLQRRNPNNVPQSCKRDCRLLVFFNSIQVQHPTPTFELKKQSVGYRYKSGPNILKDSGSLA